MLFLWDILPLKPSYEFALSMMSLNTSILFILFYFDLQERKEMYYLTTYSTHSIYGYI